MTVAKNEDFHTPESNSAVERQKGRAALAGRRTAWKRLVRVVGEVDWENGLAAVSDQLQGKRYDDP